MSPKELPPPSRAGGLMDVLRARHQREDEPGSSEGEQSTTLVPAVVDPFAPQPVDPATVTGTAGERLAAFEGAIDRAKETASQTLKAARARFVVEAGTALRAIRDEDGGLYKVTHATFEDYIRDRWDMDRSRAYQLIDAAPAMLAMWKIFDKAPVESHAAILAPVLEDHGEAAVKTVVEDIGQSGGKVTAAAIRETAQRLGYVPKPAQTPENEDEPDDPPAGLTPEQVKVLALARLQEGFVALRTAHKALRGRVIPDAVAADHEQGSRLVAQVADLAAKISRLAQ